MGYAAIPTKNPGDILTSALWNTYIQGNADSGFMRMLADTTLGAPAASIDFTGIPATFAHLLLVWAGRGDSATNSVSVSLRLNGDSGANYDVQRSDNSGTATLAESQNLAQTSMLAGNMAAASSTAGRAGSGLILLPGYAGTTLDKLALLLGIDRNNAAIGLDRNFYGGHWASVAAINRLTLLPGAGNFAAGTRATLYGLPA